MPRSLLVLVLLVCSLGLCAADSVRAEDKEPKSNNKGKIVGKWKITGGSEMKAEDLKMLENFKLIPYMDFKEDGIVTFGIDTNDAEMKKLLAKDAEKNTYRFNYKLGAGDEVELSVPKDAKKGGPNPFGKKERFAATIKIDGDKMVLTDDEKKTLELKKLPKDK
jgi:hypothetical protein